MFLLLSSSPPRFSWPAKGFTGTEESKRLNVDRLLKRHMAHEVKLLKHFGFVFIQLVKSPWKTFGKGRGNSEGDWTNLLSVSFKPTDQMSDLSASLPGSYSSRLPIAAKSAPMLTTQTPPVVQLKGSAHLAPKVDPVSLITQIAARPCLLLSQRWIWCQRSLNSVSPP